MSKSTMIKDLNMKTNKEKLNDDQGEDDITIQEVITEINNEKQEQQQPINVNMQTKNESINLNEFSNQLLQQQLLQQQLLQQQILQQKDTIGASAGGSTSTNGVMYYLSVLFKEFLAKKNEFIGILILHIIFSKLDISTLLKIDKLVLFQTYPYLESLVRSILFSILALLVSHIA
jgi:hypothetical protein